MEFVRVARSGQIPEGIVRRFFVNGVELAVARSEEGAVHVMSNYCTHLDCLLSSGRVTDDGLLCSCHGSVFDFDSGEPITPPATRPVRVFEAKEEDGQVYVALPAETQRTERPKRRLST
ncbi:nitrite reductase/ring-hydroxylating ferredoxin subunit [Spinactinospora alkalitolerans]|uniref:Nitrite reductase/ring-hydroxylating ferredoxin subunit n=1 Tax=Spinactinospora alkalitolerans TaxID=687207 RepID=A0A852U1V8_9ACTN|nr:Rieske (2Fe-2S) protein [Spinactinospora alkalitolerans]NYE47970.1 nitrite reductase/ring-hydroxylating ferredoxin subunit [Spinactinospora alkalitolerans]